MEENKKKRKRRSRRRKKGLPLRTKMLVATLCIVLAFVIKSCLERDDFYVTKPGTVTQQHKLHLDSDDPQFFTLMYDIRTSRVQTETGRPAKVLDVQVDKLTFKISDFTGTGNPVLNGVIRYSKLDGSDVLDIAELPELPLSKLAEGDGEIEVPLEPEVARRLSEVLSDDGKASLAIVGKSSENNMDCKINLNVHMKVKMENN